MEMKIVTVRAEKTKDGKIVYRGGKAPGGTMSQSPWKIITAIWAAVIFLAVVASLLISTHGAETKTKEVQAPVVSAENALELCRIAMNEPIQIIETENDEVEYVDDELVEMLALVIYQEAGGDACSDDTRRMIGEVAMNRVADSRFPNTLEEVLLQKQAYGRLYWTGLVWPDRASLDEESHAVQRAYDIARIVLTSDERLLPVDVIFQAEFRQGIETVAEADGFYFCR